MGPGARANVAFSCWRGLASSVKARQRLYRRKMQGRASPLQREVRGRWHSAAALFLLLRPCRSLGLRRLTELGMQLTTVLKRFRRRSGAGVRFETRNQDALVLS